ncbi:MAG: hypothetical protein ACFBSD_14785 [Paracoccaceae bacterium]
MIWIRGVVTTVFVFLALAAPADEGRRYVLLTELAHRDAVVTALRDRAEGLDLSFVVEPLDAADTPHVPADWEGTPGWIKADLGPVADPALMPRLFMADGFLKVRLLHATLSGCRGGFSPGTVCLPTWYGRSAMILDDVPTIADLRVAGARPSYGNLRPIVLDPASADRLCAFARANSEARVALTLAGAVLSVAINPANVFCFESVGVLVHNDRAAAGIDTALAIALAPYPAPVRIVSETAIPTPDGPWTRFFGAFRDFPTGQ